MKQILRDAERKYTLEEVQMHKHISSSLWKVINRTIPSKDKDKLIYTRNHKTVTNGFNNFFTSVGRNASESAVQLAEEHNIVMTEQEGPPLTIPTSELFNFRAVTCEDVQRIISSLPLNKSPGVDKLNARIFKDSLPVILGPLTDIINSSLSTCSFPRAGKEVEVVPILKKGDHEVASNNRPLSLLPVAAKVCEKQARWQGGV